MRLAHELESMGFDDEGTDEKTQGARPFEGTSYLQHGGNKQSDSRTCALPQAGTGKRAQVSHMRDVTVLSS